MSDADALTAALEDIRPLADCQGDVAALLAAVEDMLKLATDWEEKSRYLYSGAWDEDREADEDEEPETGRGTFAASLYHDRAVEVRATITKHLTGEGNDGG